jgi:hypothetical protein
LGRRLVAENDDIDDDDAHSAGMLCRRIVE